MLPQAFLERMKDQLGAAYDAYIESLERPRAVALRFNPFCAGKCALGAAGILL